MYKKIGKCYPVPSGDVTICNHNKDGRCVRWDKRCNNVLGSEDAWLEKTMDEMIAITEEENENE